MQRTIRLYACGGAGMNIASKYKALNKSTAGSNFADIQPCYVDTSSANVTPLINTKDLFLVESMDSSVKKDGSGKIRRANHPDIKARTPACLLAFKPEAMNIVLHSASGGSGSVIGPLLVEELLRRGEQVLVMMIGSKDSRIEIYNTVKTLETYEATARNTKRPVVAIVEYNDEHSGRINADKSMHVALDIISGFWSGTNAELDTADLNNFLNYPNATSFDPALSALSFFSKEVVLGKDQVAISAATLTDVATPSVINTPVEYQAVGFIPENAKTAYAIDMPLHAVVVGGVYHPMIVSMNAQLTEYDTRRGAVKVKTLEVDVDTDTEDGSMKF